MYVYAVLLFFTIHFLFQNQLLHTGKPQGLLTPPRTPAMLAIVLFVTLGLMFSPIRYISTFHHIHCTCILFRTMITGSVEYEHSVPVKMHRALLSVEDTAIPNDHTPISRAVGPHLTDQLVPVTAMDNVKSLHKAKKKSQKKVIKTAINVNASDAGVCVCTSFNSKYGIMCAVLAHAISRVLAFCR